MAGASVHVPQKPLRSSYLISSMKWRLRGGASMNVWNFPSSFLALRCRSIDFEFFVFTKCSTAAAIVVRVSTGSGSSATPVPISRTKFAARAQSRTPMPVFGSIRACGLCPLPLPSVPR